MGQTQLKTQAFADSAVTTSKIADEAVTKPKTDLDTWHVVGAVGEPAYQNSWRVYYSGEWGSPAFYKDAMGFVHLRGLAQKTSPITGIIFTLPAGYRPATVSSGHIFGCLSGAGIARVDVLPGGNVAVNGSYATDWLSLNNIHFLAEN